MSTPAWNDLLRLPEKPAGWAYLAGSNRAHLRWMLVASMLVAAVVVMVHAVGDDWWGAAPWIAVLVYGVVLIGIRDRPFFRRRSDDFLLGLVLFVLAAIATTLPDAVGVFIFSSLMLPMFLLLLRWRGTRLAALAAGLLAVALWSGFRARGETTIALLVLAPVLIGAQAWIGWRLTRRRLAVFFDEYRRQASVERDRARMSEELSDARAVQLSMLPHESPELAWVDVASASLPAWSSPMPIGFAVAARPILW